MYDSRSLAISVLVFLLGSLTWQTTAAAEDTGPSSSYKIGVVNLKEIFDNYEKQKERYRELEKQRDEMQKPIDDLSAKIEANKNRYDSEASQMSEDERRELQDLIEADYSRYQAEFKRLQGDLDRAEKRILEELFEDIQKAIEEVGKDQNYHIIFEGGDNKRSGVLYYSTTLNMTQRVIDYLNSKHSES